MLLLADRAEGIYKCLSIFIEAKVIPLMIDRFILASLLLF
ncbi:hypothetical protein PJE062_1577 [Pseudovibrio sp. JE062]|nr:hypothetical protein PJE062_1577 [Pseudovibrio sp. JE062]